MQHYVRLPLKGTTNTRDLGGYATKDGRITKWQVFLRSDDVCDLTKDDIKFLKRYGMTTVIDLRSAPELMDRPNPFAIDPQVNYVNISLYENASPAVIASLPSETLKNMYVEILELHREQVKAVFETIANAPEGTILFHCAAGKDRTGVIAFLLMGLVQVKTRDIVSNYEVSFTNLRRNDYFKNHEDPSSAFLYSPSNNMEETVAYVKAHYKTPEAYLLAIGLSQETLERIKARFTEAHT